MNCSQCQAELKDGAKFCTSCGTRAVAQNTGGQSSVCVKCAAPLKPNAKFCTSCGEKTGEQSPTPVSGNNTTEMQVVKQRIFWNIQPGEIARKINEAEFIQYDNTLGLIINDGTTAYIRSEGKQIAEIRGGVYNFIDPEELDKIIETRVGGVAAGVKSGFKFLVNLVLGKKVKDGLQDDANDPKRQTSLSSIIECMRGDSLLSLTLKMDKDFELIFGAPQANKDSYSSFTPMSIKTKYIDAEMGVRATFKITDFHKFTQHYLTDSNCVSTSMLADKLTPIVTAAIQEVMCDVELSDSRLSPELMEKIRLKAVASANDLMYGISLVKIIEVSANNEDIERFRVLSRELYLSEKELDFLNRTNEFKNRLSTVTANQAVHEEESELALRKRLDEINKDRLLHEDELEKFNQALQVDKIIRAAHGQEEVDAALLEIEKRGLLRADEYNRLADTVRRGEYDRELAFDLAQIKGNVDRHKAEFEAEKAELERIRQQRLGLADIEVQEQKLKDDYQIDHQTRARSAEMDLDDRELDAQLERLRKLKEIEQAEEVNRHKLEMERARMDKDHDLKTMELKYSASQNLSPQQLMAMAAQDNLDSEAAVRLAESFSASMSAEQQASYIAEFNKLNQARIDDKERDADRLERMMGQMMAATQNMTGHLVHHTEKQKEEYKDRLYRQEDRLDRTQDRALDYTTKNNAIGGTIPPPPPRIQIVYHVAMPTGESAPHDLQQLQQLIKQGVVTKDTYIYPSNVANWVTASTLSELASFFTPTPMQEGMPKCHTCGVSLIAGEKFCENCGNPT